jgi:hypothetical protein
LKALATLDKGITPTINGKKTTVIASAMAFTGDMPQQQANAGMKSHNAKRGCR